MISTASVWWWAELTAGETIKILDYMMPCSTVWMNVKIMTVIPQTMRQSHSAAGCLLMYEVMERPGNITLLINEFWRSKLHETEQSRIHWAWGQVEKGAWYSTLTWQLLMFCDTEKNWNWTPSLHIVNCCICGCSSSSTFYMFHSRRCRRCIKLDHCL